MKPKCILTDLGSTLIYNNDPAIYKKGLAQLGINVDPLAMDLAFHKADKHFMRYFPGLFMKKTEVYREVYLGVVNYNLGLDLDLAQCAQQYQNAAEVLGFRWQLFDGVLETIASLRRQQTKIVLVSNWDHSCRQVLKDTGLFNHFDHLIISEEVGYEKPSKEIFEIAMEQAEVNAWECLFVGDNFYDDGAGSEKLNIPYVIINPYDKKGVEELNCPVITGFSQLPQWMVQVQAA